MSGENVVQRQNGEKKWQKPSVHLRRPHECSSTAPLVVIRNVVWITFVSSPDKRSKERFVLPFRWQSHTRTLAVREHMEVCISNNATWSCNYSSLMLNDNISVVFESALPRMKCQSFRELHSLSVQHRMSVDGRTAESLGRYGTTKRNVWKAAESHQEVQRSIQNHLSDAMP